MKQNLKATISILSLSTVTNITTIVTGVIPQLKQSFPTIPTTLIEWSVTVANLSALVTLLLNPKLTEKFSIKAVVVTGLIFSALTGLIPAFINNFWAIFVSRILLGLGVGLFSPHAISLIAHSYSGELRARLLGYQTGLTALGNSILLALAGILIGISWHQVFFLYLLLLVVALLIFFFVPNVKVEAKESKATLPKTKWRLILIMFVTYLLIWGVQLKLPSYFTFKKLGDSQIINWTLSAMNLGGLLAGLSFGFVHKKIHRYTLTLGYCGAAISLLLLWLTNNGTVAIVSAVFFNFIYSYTGPFLVFTSNQGLKQEQINTLSSYLTIATIISAFFAPLLWNTLGIFGTGDVSENVLFLITLLLFSLTILSISKKFIVEK